MTHQEMLDREESNRQESITQTARRTGPPLTEVPSLLDFNLLYRTVRDIQGMSEMPRQQERVKDTLAEINAVATEALAHVKVPKEKADVQTPDTH